MRIYDGFLFNDELDLLELRLMELYDLVDRFVLVEGQYDFQMHPKPLYYAENRGRFERWNDKIVQLVPTVPIEPHPVIEHETRRHIADGFDDMDFNDLFLLGDVDEIPSRKAIIDMQRRPPNGPMVLRQHLYYYRVTNHAGFWQGTIVSPRGLGKCIDLQGLRDQRNLLPVHPVNPGGWHFSWLGNADAVKKKLTCIDVRRDAELYTGKSSLPFIPDPEKDSEFVERAVQVGADLFKRDKKYTTQLVQPGVMQPHAISEWLADKDDYA